MGDEVMRVTGRLGGKDMVLLIGGHPRSGTTLLRNLCNGHPDMVVTHEFGNFQYLGTPCKEYMLQMLKRLWDKGILENRFLLWPGIDQRWMKGANILRAHVFAARYLFNIHKFKREIIDVPTIEAALRSIFPKTLIVGDKLPDYVFSLNELAETSGLSCLIIYRDCRDVTSSVLEKTRTTWRNKMWVKDFDTTEKIARRWVLAIEQMERYKDNVHIVRYEDLVHHPERELVALGKWLGVDPAGFPTAMVQNTGIGKYKRALTDEELATVMEIAGPTMERLRYI